MSDCDRFCGTTRTHTHIHKHKHIDTIHTVGLRENPGTGFIDGMILEEPRRICQIPHVLRSGNVFQPNINDDLVFTKGTITRFLASITSR